MNLKESKEIVEELGTNFSSHDFIEKFAFYHEEAYIGMLYACKGKHAFQTVHAQIGRFLSDNKIQLNIKKTERKENKNVFGNETEVQFWSH
jgi:hypothetical protein